MGIDGGFKIRFVTEHQHGTNVGARLYMLDDDDKYMMFYLKNREFSIDIDVSNIQCGMNGAMYFVEMDQDGGKGRGQNQAGAKFGTGYCDAQCPHDIKFIDGEANVLDWKPNPKDKSNNMGVGHHGSCCAEMDIWEATTTPTPEPSPSPEPEPTSEPGTTSSPSCPREEEIDACASQGGIYECKRCGEGDFSAVCCSCQGGAPSSTTSTTTTVMTTTTTATTPRIETGTTTTSPALSGKCKAWCATNGKSWEKKCKWAGCAGCSECDMRRLRANNRFLV